MGNRSEKSNVIKSREIIIFGISIVLIVVMGIIVYLSGFHIDFTQKYRTIDGYENIVFKDSWNQQCYRLCAWGLVKTENIPGFEEHRDPDTSSYEYQKIVKKANAKFVWQVVPSPDGKYILYVERIYRGTGTTDDEDVYYKVYSIDDGTTTTIYSGYKQFLLVDWK
ncbi:MAG: hypothetical protein IKH46_10990 [Lachnospiraceae bacterium]|nr:hypothetical protein [Lachnospiraceae bacterium]MBR6850386.1 hypothetical protein [Lachnospiraceae bacterium]